MTDPRTLDAVLAECRFVVSKSDLLGLLPETAEHLPPLQSVGFMDDREPHAVLAWPVVASPRLTVFLYRLCGVLVRAALQDPEGGTDLARVDAEEGRDDPYLETLVDLLRRTLSHGAGWHLDALLWLQLSGLIAAVLNGDDEVARAVGRDDPRLAESHSRTFLHLLRLRGTDMDAHAAVKRAVLARILARHERALREARSAIGDDGAAGLARELSVHRLAFTERVDALYWSFDLREAASVQGRGPDPESLESLRRLVRGLVEEIYLDTESGSAEVRWFRSSFLTDAVLEKASRLHLADPSQDAAAAPRSPAEDFAAQVGFLVSLQDEPVRYLLHHLERLPHFRSASRRHAFPRDFLRRLKDPASLLELAAPFGALGRDARAWDFVNAARRFVLPVTRTARCLRSQDRDLLWSVVPLDLAHETRVHVPVRHATAVCFALPDLATRALHALGEGGAVAEDVEFDAGRPARGDGAALALQRALAGHRKVGAFGGVAEGAWDGVMVDLFPRALDALRYAATLLSCWRDAARLPTGPGGAMQDSPFDGPVRIALATGPYAVLSMPGPGGSGGEEFARPRPVGGPFSAAWRLARGTRGAPSNGREARPAQPRDPLKLLRAQLQGGHAVFDGICLFERTGREIKAEVRLESLPHWAPEAPSGEVAGVVPAFQHYRFELVFDDPATGLVFLVRRVGVAAGFDDVLEDEQAVWEVLPIPPASLAALIQADSRLPKEASRAPSARPGVFAPLYDEAGASAGETRRTSPPGTPPSAIPPISASSPPPGDAARPPLAGSSPSLFGPQGDELVARIDRLGRSGAIRLPEGGGVLPGDVPDLELLLRGYVYVSDAGEGRVRMVLGRRVRDVLFDCHVVEGAKTGPAIDLDQAIEHFLIRKAAARFVPSSLSFERLTEEALARCAPLPADRAKAAYERLRARGEV